VVMGGSSEISSLQPNQPGVLQVDDDLVVVDVVVESEVVVSSRQPHQPGVLHVEVRVVFVVKSEVVVVVALVEVVWSERLDSKKSQLKQSVQSAIGSHLAA